MSRRRQVFKARRWKAQCRLQYWLHQRSYARARGAHDNWWRLGQEALAWDAYVALHPEAAQQDPDDVPF